MQKSSNQKKTLPVSKTSTRPPSEKSNSTQTSKKMNSKSPLVGSNAYDITEEEEYKGIMGKIMQEEKTSQKSENEFLASMGRSSQ